jgi:hypothetical protein
MVERVVAALLRQLAAPDAAPLREVLPGALLLRGSARIPGQGVAEQDGQRVWRG